MDRQIRIPHDALTQQFIYTIEINHSNSNLIESNFNDEIVDEINAFYKRGLVGCDYHGDAIHDILLEDGRIISTDFEALDFSDSLSNSFHIEGYNGKFNVTKIKNQT